MTSKRIGIITSWNAVCGVSEFANFLVEALEKRGHTFEIFANLFAGDYEKIPEEVRKDGPNVSRVFETGFNPDPYNRQFFDVIEIEATIVSKKLEIIFLNYQDFLFPNKPALNIIIEFCKNNGVKTFILTHDSCISPELNVSDCTHIVFSPAVWQFQAHSKALNIDQGIPELEFKRCTLPDSWNHEWTLSCFGMGRNRVDKLVSVIENVNEEKLLDKPLALELSCRKGHYQEYKKHPYVRLAPGYLPAQKLSYQISCTDAVVIWYPDIAQQANSSAFRFAVGSRVPIICNNSSWVSDQISNGAWVEVAGDDPELFKRAIVKLFQKDTYPVAREKMTILQQKLIDKSGWSKIAETYEQYF